jgi:amidase
MRKEQPEKCTGELFGIPMCVKDQYDMKGLDTHKGSASHINKSLTANSLPIRLLKKAGAIPFVKANVP